MEQTGVLCMSSNLHVRFSSVWRSDALALGATLLLRAGRDCKDGHAGGSRVTMASNTISVGECIAHFKLLVVITY